MKFLRRIFPFLFLLILVVIIYYPFFFQKKIPFSGDLLVGAYYPWLDYKWGTITGVPVKNPELSDLFSIGIPFKYLMVDIFKSKQLPLWNIFSFSGSPFLADYCSSVFFPGNIVLFLPKYFSWGIFIIIQTLTAGFGMLFFLKKHISNLYIRIISSLIFMLSGLMTTWAEFGGGVGAIATIPWALFFINLYIDRKRIFPLIMMSFCLVSLYFAGNYQIALYGSILIGFYLLFNIKNHSISFKNIIPICLYIILSIGISLIILLPVFSQTHLSVRSSEVYSKAYNYGLIPISNFIRLFAADFFGNPTTYNYRGAFMYYENSPFLGSLTLPLILPLFFKSFRKKKNIFWLITLFLSLLLILDSPLTQLIYRQNLPFLTFSSASRMLFITSLSVAILSSSALSLLKDKKYQRHIKIFCFIFIFIIILSLINLKINDTPQNFTVSLRNSIIPLTLLLIPIILFRFSFLKKIYLPIFLLLFFLDFSHYFWKFNPFVDSSFIFPVTPAITFLQEQKGIFRIGRLNREILTPNTWMHYKLSSVEGYDPLVLENYSRFMNRVNNNKYYDGVNRYVELYTPDFNFLKSLNVKYLLSVNKDQKPSTEILKNNKDLEIAFIDKSTVIYENKNFLERAYFVKNTISAKDHTEVAKIIDDKNFNPLNDTVVLTQDHIPNNWSVGTVEIKSYQNNSLSLETTNQKDGFLVLSDTYHPGWHIYIDGSEEKLYEVNGALRGVIVPLGNHQIKMTFWPDDFALAVKISLGSLFGMVILSIYLFIKNKCHH